ncbi:MAG: hypothetical protein ABI653_07395, partial [Bacteroidota bacterium]
MNTEEYIQSGIIESCVLGLASQEEVSSLEALCVQYPEIKKAVQDFELLMEKNAFDNAIAPPSEVRNNIINALKDEFNTESSTAKIADSREATILPMHTNAKVKVFSFWRYAAVASIILLLSSVGLNY